MKRGRLVIAILGICLSFMLLVPFITGCAKPTVAPTTAKPFKTKLIFAAGTSAESSDFVGYAKLAELGFALIPGVSYTMVPSGGGLAAYNNFLAGEADLCVTTAGQFLESITGTGTYAGKPQPNNQRALFAHKSTISPIAVWADSKYNTVSDLAGKRVFQGYSGTTIYAQTKAAFDAIGLKVIDTPGSLSDGIAMMKDGRTEAFTKSVPGHTLDASHFEITQTGRKLRFIGYTPEQIAKILEKYPTYSYKLLPKGWFTDLPEQGDVWVNELISVVVCKSEFPEEWAYLWTKNNVEKVNDIISIFPAAGLVEPIKDAVKVMSQVKDFYLHPGAIRYYREKGVQVPQGLIPPEMK